MPLYEPAPMDVAHLEMIREGVRSFLARVAVEHRCVEGRMLDIAPQDHEGAAPHFPELAIETFDIDPASGADHIGDITNTNEDIASGSFDYIVCTEVLEHTAQPFDAAAEMARLLRPGGLLFLTVPLNFRIHGPLPDNWRFTEHGVRAIFSRDFDEVELTAVETPDRPLMPIQYQLVARRR